MQREDWDYFNKITWFLSFVSVGECNAVSPSFPMSFRDGSHSEHWQTKLDTETGAQ